MTSKTKDNGNRLRDSDRLTFKILTSGPMIALAIAIVLGGIKMYFDIEANAGEIKNIKEAVQEQTREQSRNQREINEKLTVQATTNGRIEATQSNIQMQLNRIIKMINENYR